MKAGSMNVRKFLSQTNTQFVIPVYQRNYDWTITQCKQLMDDILEVGDDDSIDAHFIGSIVYLHDDPYTASDINELTIIDGQQRLTTLTLLYIALFRLAQKIANGKSDEINETYLINKFAVKEKLKLRPTENNDKAIRFLLNNGVNEVYPEFSRIIENFDYLSGRINEQAYDNVLKGLSKLVFVEISLEQGKDDPQKIFESINSTGLELSQADLIRNYVLMGLKHDEQKKRYETYWEFIEQNAKNEEAKESKVSDFIRDYLTFEDKKIPNKNKVYAEFKNKYPVPTSNNVDTVLKRLKALVKHYNKLLNPKNEPCKNIQQELEYLKKLDVNVAFPFLLQVYDDYVNDLIDESIFINVLQLVQSFVWRRFIAGLPTNALNKIFMSLYEKVDKENYLRSIQVSLVQRSGTQKFPPDAELIDALKLKDVYNINPKNTRYLLERLENYNNPKEKVVVEGNPDITIEHIFPQHPDLSWKSSLSPEDYTALKDTYLHTIENLTLSGNNGELGNKSFSEKKILRETGYRDSRLWLNKYLAAIDAWNIVELEKRFDTIKELFLKIWPYPAVELNVPASEGEVSLFDAEDPTSKKMDYFIFFDEKKLANSFVDFYVGIIRQLFDLQPETFFTTDIAEKLEIKRKEEQTKLRRPCTINDNWFIEGKLSNTRKFNRLKYLLTALNIEDELLIKYQN